MLIRLLNVKYPGEAGWRNWISFSLLVFLLAGCQIAQAAPVQQSEPARVRPSQVMANTFTPTTAVETTAVTERTATTKPKVTPQPAPTFTQTSTRPPEGVYFPPGRVTVPILMYHNISDKGSTAYVIRVADFRKQMNALAGAGYQTVTVSELAAVIRNGGYLPAKPVVITFDDGFLGVYENAFPIMEALGFRGVAYLISGTIGTDLSYGYMQPEEIKALVESGWEIGSHSVSHSNLKTTRLGLRNEVEGSRKDLEEILEMPVRSFAYPYNVANQWIRERVEEYGYESAVGVDIFNSHPPERLFFLSRRAVLREMNLQAFLALLEKDGE